MRVSPILIESHKPVMKGGLMVVLAVDWALPPHRYSQSDLFEAFKEEIQGRYFNLDRIQKLHQNVMVGHRYLALPPSELIGLKNFGQANDAFIRVGLDLGEKAIHQACEQAGVKPADLDAILFTTVTGLATPSMDARLINRMNLDPHIARMPFFGLGCVGGAAGLSRCSDWLKAHPKKLAVLLSIELCSLTIQRQDLSIPNLISTGLFGDGAAAVVAAGAEHPLASATQGPHIRATQSVFYPDTESVMGWNISESGFEIVLSAEVPQMVRDNLRTNVDSFLKNQGLTRKDLTIWVCHPGGPKVLEAVQAALEIDKRDLQISWDALLEMGNLSSASVLINLGKTQKTSPPSGSLGLLLAMGPGFCSELLLLEWP
jgi:alkylresorcinol/alkylpyrone synthase